MAIGRAGKQATAFNRPRHGPVRRCIRPKVEKAAIIFRVANHHQSTVSLAIRHIDTCRHQGAPQAAALDVWQYGHRADHDQWDCGPGICCVERDRPALQRPHQQPIVPRGEAERGQLCHTSSDSIGGAAKAVRPECSIKQRLYRNR